MKREQGISVPTDAVLYYGPHIDGAPAVPSDKVSLE